MEIANLENITLENENTGSKQTLTLDECTGVTGVMYSVVYINYGAESHETIIRKTLKGAKTQFNILKNTYFRGV